MGDLYDPKRLVEDRPSYWSGRIAREGSIDGDVTIYPRGSVPINVTHHPRDKTNILYLDEAFTAPGTIKRNAERPYAVDEGMMFPALFVSVARLEEETVASVDMEAVIVRLVGDPDKKPYVMRRYARPRPHATDQPHRVTFQRHTFLPRVWMIFVTETHIYTVLEHCPLAKLVSHLSAQTPLPLLRVYAAELLLLIKSYHDQDGWVFRNIHPDALYMTRAGHLRLVDSRFHWSIAEAYGTASPADLQLSSTSAPELALRHEEPSMASDMWAVGATILRLAIGRDLFLHCTSPAAFKETLHYLFRTPAAQSTFDDDLHKLLFNLLVFEPEKRISAAMALKSPFIDKLNSPDGNVNGLSWELQQLELRQHQMLFIASSLRGVRRGRHSNVTSEQSLVLPTLERSPGAAAERRDPVEDLKSDWSTAPRKSSSAVPGNTSLFPRPESARSWSEYRQMVQAQEREYAEAAEAQGEDEGPGVPESSSQYAKRMTVSFSLRPLADVDDEDDAGQGSAGKRRSLAPHSSSSKGKAHAAPPALPPKTRRRSASGNRRDRRRSTPSSAPSDMVSAVSSNSTTVIDGGAMFRTKDGEDLTYYDFIRVAVLGKGAFGRVSLAYIDGDPEQHYVALKEIDKAALAKSDATMDAEEERRVMLKIRGRSFVRLHHAFDTPHYLYLVLDFCEGGSLRRVLADHYQGKPLPPMAARFYIEHITFALDQMHDKGFVYRDLKPGNILVSHTGNIRLADFGLACYHHNTMRRRRSSGSKSSTSNASDASSMLHNVVGSPAYMAPELVEDVEYRSYDAGVDHWALGVLAFELLTGHRPFVARKPANVYDSILNDEPNLKEIPDTLSRKLVRDLLKKNPKVRLGRNERVRTHSFFDITDWNNVMKRRIAPPYIPPVGPGEYKAELFGNRSLDDDS